MTSPLRVAVGPSWLDLVWQGAFRGGYRLARLWWRVRRPRHEGALVAIHVGDALLLLRSSYRSGWNLPGGGVKRGETPEQAARRELREEIGFEAPSLVPAGFAEGRWDGRQDRVHFFTLDLPSLPELTLDQREIVEARLAGPDLAREMAETGALTGPLEIYVGRKSGTER